MAGTEFNFINERVFQFQVAAILKAILNIRHVQLEVAPTVRDEIVYVFHILGMFAVSTVDVERGENISMEERGRRMTRVQVCPQSDFTDEGDGGEELLDPDTKPLFGLLVSQTLWKLVNVPPLDLLDLSTDSGLEVELLLDPGNQEHANSFESDNFLQINILLDQLRNIVASLLQDLPDSAVVLLLVFIDLSYNKKQDELSGKISFQKYLWERSS